MTIEQQALALVNEVRAEGNLTPVDDINYGIWAGIALKRALERHEAFRQEVSEAVANCFRNGSATLDTLSRFIIAPPADPIKECLAEAYGSAPEEFVGAFKNALAKYGLQITGVET